MAVHQRHADRGIGVEHLLGRDDLDLVGIDVEAEIVERDLLDRVIGARQRREVPLGAVEEEAVAAVAALRAAVAALMSPPPASAAWRRARGTPG